MIYLYFYCLTTCFAHSPLISSSLYTFFHFCSLSLPDIVLVWLYNFILYFFLMKRTDTKLESIKMRRTWRSRYYNKTKLIQSTTNSKRRRRRKLLLCSWQWATFYDTLQKHTCMDVYNIHEHIQDGNNKKRIIIRLSKNLFIYIQSLFALPTITVQSQKYFFYFLLLHIISQMLLYLRKKIIHRHVCVYFVKLFSKERKFLFHSYLLSVLIILFFIFFMLSLYIFFFAA